MQIIRRNDPEFDQKLRPLLERSAFDPAIEKAVGDGGLVEGALEWSERFSWTATANRFLELYEGAARGRETPS